MRTLRPLFLLGTMSAAVSSALAVDTSQWKCESCPFDKDTVAATVDGGVAWVSEESRKYGDYSGLDRKGAYVVAGGGARFRSGNGYYGNVTASDLGLQSRSAAAEGGLEGAFRLNLGYSEIPRHLTDGAMTPFQNVGGSVLTLPAGYPAATTAGMPLSSTLLPVDVGYKRQRYDAGATAFAGQAWSFNVNWRRDVRDGTLKTAGSFFSTSAQLVAPVDQVTDQLEVKTAYNGSRFQASLGGQLSVFRNNQDSLTWTNPFTPLVAGGDTGQLALPPDNKFWQLGGSLGYDIAPRIRASGDFAIGRMTQDASFVAPTLNPNLAPAAQAAMPGQSLNGRADTTNASLKVTASPIDALRVNVSYAHDERENKTPSESYPPVEVDTFLGTTARTNQPFSFKQDRYKLDAEYRVIPQVRASVGAEQDHRDRTLQEVLTTRETTFWGQVGAQPLPDYSLSFKYARSSRSSSDYTVAAWIDPPENPLLRKFNLAERTRNKGTLRADANVAENLSIGFNFEIADDDYRKSTIGLLDARTVDFGVDASAALTDQLQLFVFAQSDRIRSRQTGSQVFAGPDWTAHNRDVMNAAGLGVKYAALKDKLDLGADFTVARTRGDVNINAGPADPPFPAARTARDSLRLRANYKMSSNLSLLGRYGYERYSSRDWRYDGVLADTIPNLLAFGEQPPHYRVHLISIAVRYRL
jgi:MtrB/PioB family decaheme-associated outer membrane protein